MLCLIFSVVLLIEYLFSVQAAQLQKTVHQIVLSPAHATDQAASHPCKDDHPGVPVPGSEHEHIQLHPGQDWFWFLPNLI